MDISNLKRSEIEKMDEMNNIKEFIYENKIDLNWVSNFRQIIYHYINKITNIPICNCGNYVKFRSFNLGYREYCSPKCSANSEKTKINLKKSKQKKYGDPNYNNHKKMLETKREKYGDSNYNNREKAIKTNVEIYGFESPMKNNNIKKKSKETKLKKYGDVNYNNSEKIKAFWSNISEEYKENFIKKIKQSKLKIYGDENFNNSNKMIKTKVDRGILRDKLSDLNFKEYKNKVRSSTNIKRKDIYKNWDGLDFYTGEYIKDNLKLKHTNRLYPTIDHKIPIIKAYSLGLSVDDVASFDNLCITTRELNSIKRDMDLNEFIQLIENRG